MTTQSRTDVTIRSMVAGDIPRVIALQIAFLEGSIITELGPRFLTRFHEAALEHAGTRAFVAVRADEVVGFSVSSTAVDEFNRHVKPRVFGAVLTALAAPHRWHLLPSVARATTEHDPEPPIPAELLLLVVDTRVRRQGIGRRLVDSLEQSFAGEEIARYRVAVRSHLAVARAFYLARGFEPEQEREVLGHPMTYLTKRVPIRS